MSSDHRLLVLLPLLAAFPLAACSEGDTDPLAELLTIADQNITAIEVVATKTTIAVTEIFQIQAVNGPGGSDITTVLRWTSLNPDVVAVTGAGVIEGIAEGTARITARIGDLEGFVDLVVSSAPIVAVAVTAPSLLDACDSVQFTAQATFADGRDEDVTDTATWQSSDTTFTDFDADIAGLLHTNANGNVDITATAGSITSAVLPVIIADSLTALSINAGSTTVAVGATETLTAAGAYTDSTSRDISRNVTWASATPAVASIDDSGVLTGEVSGSVEVTATCNAVVGRLTFAIGDGAASVINLEVAGTQPLAVQLGASLQLTLTAEFSDGTTRDVTEDAQWSVALSLGSGAVNVGNTAGNKGLVTTNFIGVSVIRATFEGEEELIDIDVTP